MGYRQAVKAQHFDCCIVGSIPTSPVYGTLAQMVEHLTFNQVVGGSSPPCLTFFLFSFSFFLRRHNNIASSHFACSNEPCADMETESCCVLARKQIEVYMDAYGECRDSERKAQRFSAGRSRACRHGELRSLCIRRMPQQFNTSLLCSYGGIGRRGRFRFCWATPVQVQVLLAALFFCFLPGAGMPAPGFFSHSDVLSGTFIPSPCTPGRAW